jgi:hypothetical protein
MHIGSTDADERTDIEIHICTYRNFVPSVNYFIDATVFLSIRVTFFPA